MKKSTSKLNPYAVSCVPVAKLEVHNVDNECKTMSKDAAVDDLILNSDRADDAHVAGAEIPLDMDSDFIDEKSEMELAYLQMMFPGVSDEFLVEVFNVSSGELEAAIDILSELESTDDQQDGSNIDNTRKPVSFAECSSVKAVPITGESSTSSGSSGATIATS